MQPYAYTLTHEYLSLLKPREVSFLSKRENILVGIQDFILWILKNYGLSVYSVKGVFFLENIVFDKQDFSPDMKLEFKQSGLNFNKQEDRKSWIENSPYSEELKKVTHIWCLDSRNNIYDPFGVLQFLKKGKIPDLSFDRYLQLE